MSNKEQQIQSVEIEEEKPKCGIVMPISAIDGCSAEHWDEVKNILYYAIKEAGYTPNLVSDANDSGIIQKRIVQNLYDNEIVICDVSCKNPNVMFELGMRLAFDKPTIIVIDDKTDYSFDTAPIEHLKYPRDLTYFKILKFQKNLKDKIVGTIQAAKGSEYTTFLKNFGEFKVAKIEHKQGSFDEAILARINEVLTEVQRLKQHPNYNYYINNKDVMAKDINYLYKLIDKEIDNYCEQNNVKRSHLEQISRNSNEWIRLINYITKNKDILNFSINDIEEGINNFLSPF